MISYRTLLFGTIAVVAAAAPAAPAYADSAHAQPLAMVRQQDSAHAQPLDSAHAQPLDSAHAQPLNAGRAWFAEGLVQFENLLLRISL